MLNCAQSGGQLLAQFEAMADAGRDAAPGATHRRGPMDLRTYGVGAQILKDLNVGRMRLLSHPRKMPSMVGYNLQVVGFEPRG